jgi:uncharacterized protein with NAD-binding domain and iron-sulfur cluster
LSQAGWRDRYESITVYQQGWRLGGKGASGRGVNGRIEEHGLHIWMGFYLNAFRMMGDCYDELGRLKGHAEGMPPRIQDQFRRASAFEIMEERPEGWLRWAASFPEYQENPWDPGATVESPWQVLIRALELAREFARSAHDDAPPASLFQSLASGLAGLNTIVNQAELWLTRNLDAHPVAIAERALAFAKSLSPDPDSHSRDEHGVLRNMLEATMASAEKRRPVTSLLSDEGRRELYLSEIMLACCLGAVRDGVLTHGFEAIDGLDFAEWLRRNGASAEAVASPIITSLYDLGFAYKSGDPAQPRASAAAMLRGTARLFFTYRGAIAHKMSAGMGDVIFSPMYEVLSERGVDFRFFHRITNVRLSHDGRSVAAIDLERQVDLAEGRDSYSPLIAVKGRRCWPNAPLKDQLRDVDRLSPDDVESFWSQWPPAGLVSLRAGEDFDQVVLAIPVGAHQYICKQLIETNPRWARMVSGLETIYTQAFQLWLSESIDDLGSGGPPCTIGNYREPFDTCADMRQIIGSEDWPDASVRGIAYFCNAMPTPAGPADPRQADVPAKAAATVKATVVRYLQREMAELWPRAVERYPTSFKWGLLVGDESAVGPARIDTQFWRANIDPSERYVLALPGTSACRLAPGGSGYDNLFLAGDWTQCGLNSGCVESAVISGMLAANAMNGVPPGQNILGRDW